MRSQTRRRLKNLKTSNCLSHRCIRKSDIKTHKMVLLIKMLLSCSFIFLRKGRGYLSWSSLHSVFFVCVLFCSCVWFPRAHLSRFAWSCRPCNNASTHLQPQPHAGLSGCPRGWAVCVGCVCCRLGHSGVHDWLLWACSLSHLIRLLSHLARGTGPG